MTASSIQQEQQNWIILAQQGDQQAFKQLYLLHHKKVYALCYRMLANESTAEDVCQEVFVQVWQKLAHFRGESQFSTWLHSVAIRVTLNYLRQQKNWLQRVFSLENNLINTTELINQIHQNDERATLDYYISQLPERARIVFVLFAIEGYRHEEIANMMNIAIGSSKSQYHRAKQLLKTNLKTNNLYNEQNQLIKKQVV